MRLLRNWVARYDGAWTPPERPNPDKILNQTRVDKWAGRYKNALAKHVWFYERALEYEPALGGVRLSFALRYWHELGQVYPPALAKLREIRDQAAQDVKAGTNVFQSFQDMAAINCELGDELRTKDAFLALHAENAEVAHSVYWIAQSALVKAEEYQVCGKYLEPDRAFERIVELFRWHARADKRSVWTLNLRHALISVLFRVLFRLLTPRDFRLQVDAMDKQFANKGFTNDTATLVALLVLNRRTNEAARIADQARHELDDGALHKALDEALEGRVPAPWP